MKDLIAGLFLFPSGPVRLTGGSIDWKWWIALSCSGSLFAGIQLPALLDTNPLWLAILWTVVYLLFWPLLHLGLLEPLFTRIIQNGMLDEQEIYWRRAQRDRNRQVLVIGSSTLLVIFLLVTWSIQTSWGILLAAVVAMCWSIVWTTNFMRKVLNFTASVSITTGFVVFSTGLLMVMLAVSSPVGLLILCILFCFSAWFLNHDLRLRWFLRTLISDPELSDILLEDEMGSFFEELLHQCGDENLARITVNKLRSGGFNTGKVPFMMRLLNRQSAYMEAIDLGLRHEEGLSDKIEYHLAMSEASLGARDPENAAAHAEEAFELGGGLGDPDIREALFFHALASFNQFEALSGMESCEAILIGPEHASPRGMRIRKEALYLKRKFRDLNMETDPEI